MPNPDGSETWDERLARLSGRPAAPQAAEEEDSFFSPLSTALDYLSRPGRATAGFIGDALNDAPNPEARAWKNLTGERKDDFDQVLKEQGMEEGWTRTGLGLAGDIALDPLNVVGAPIIKGIGKTIKAIPGVKRAGNALANTGVVQDLAKKFVPFHGLDKFKHADSGLSYADNRRLFNSTKEARTNAAWQSVLDTFADTPLTPEMAERITFAIDKGEDLRKVPGFESLAPQMEKAKSLFDNVWNDEVARGMQNPDAKIENYVTYQMTDGNQAGALRRELSAKNKNALPRHLQTMEDVKKAGGETDIRKILGSRLANSAKATATDDFLRQTTEMFGTKVDGNVPTGFRQVSVPAEAGTKSFMEGMAFPEEIADDLERLYEIPKEVGALANAMNGTMKLWKGYATRTNPAFHIRNAASNVVNSWFGGVKFTDVVARNFEAVNWMKKPKAIGKHAPEDIQRALTEYGITGGHHTAFNEMNSLVEQSINEVGKSGAGKLASRLNPLNPTNAALHYGGKIGTAIEETSRKAVFFDQLHKGKSLEEAALHVRKYLFDYTELTDFEKTIRDRAMPFYTWVRKNLPLQVENLVTQPEKFAAIGKVQNSIEAKTDERGIRVDPSARPDYLREQNSVQLPWQTNTGANVFASIGLPMQDLNRLPLDGNLSGFLQKDILASLNPFIKMPIEWAQNKEGFTGRPIWDEDNPSGMVKANRGAQRLQSLAPKMASDLLGIKKTDKGIEQDAGMDYLQRQIPIMSQLGKTITPAGFEDVGRLGGLLSPANLSNLGITAKGLTNADLAKEAKFKREKEKRTATKQRKEAARVHTPVSKGEADAVWENVQAILNE